MTYGLMLAAVLVAVHSLSPVLADPMPTAAPLRRNPKEEAMMARRQTPAETTSPLPLTDYQYPYSAIPYQVNPYAVGRGPQSGYNLCNSTTEGPSSQCQTLVVNSLADFCVWGSPTADGSIGNTEAAVVAYCSKSGHGTRVMPEGTITGAQFMKTSAYIQVTGHFNQTGINLDPTDSGGELDPHGADLLGNPLGGLVYSTGLPSAKDNTTYLQATSWNNFVGSGIFCFKLCDPTVTSPNYCQNIFDLIGCSYNMPASYTDGEFTSCEGDLQEPAGTYVSNGQTITWSQPASLPAASTLPWTPVIPASSNCVTYSSAQLFGSLTTTSGTASKTGTVSGSGASASSHSASPTKSSGAGTLVASQGVVAFLGALVVALM